MQSPRSCQGWLRSARLLVMLLLPAVASAGCGPDGVEPTGLAEVPATLNTETPDLALQELVRSLAMAMSSPDVRALVISEMRASTFHEHKLELGSFLQQDRGKDLRFAARQYGASDALLKVVDEAFPGGLDFYVPSRGQRQAWAGTGRLLVAGVSDLDATQAVAFDTSGDTYVISSLDVPGFDAVLAIHPAEPKIARTEAMSTVGETIEDGEVVRTVSSAMNAEWCPYPEHPSCEDPPPPPPPPPSAHTRVTSIYPDFDDGFLGGDLELYFVTVDVNNVLNRYDSGIFEAEPYENNTWINVTIFDDAASAALELRAVLWESDGFFGGSDDWKGEPWPVNIKGTGDFASYDPFTPFYWAEYHVVSNP